MNSAVATTYELDDSAAAINQLAASIREKLVLDKNSLGILLCDADMDGAGVSGGLADKLGIEVAGMTTLAPIDSGGRRESAAALTVLTASDCAYYAACSTPLAGGEAEDKITRTCREIAASGKAYGEKPVLALAFCPTGLKLSGDIYPTVFARVMPDVPLIGGACSDDYDMARARVFLSGKEFKTSVLMIGVWGNARPHFAVRHVTSRFAERLRRVTRAEGNVVYRVGDEPFTRYLESFGLKTDAADPLLAFTPHPMMLTRDNSDETPLMRHIAGLDLEAGSGIFFGDVPEGAMANICLINKPDLEKSCRDSMLALFEGAAAEINSCSTVLCFSCCGRAMLMGSDSNAEGRVMSELLPGRLNLAGAYCLGELSPTSFRDGRAVNRFHNCSITFCMF
ncbi:MAG: FIST C-terminal domain-containing protein [Deltaproteobacteria bacterium]|jgi:hypothetical protein|nr:FIST C-terminal domain-containing protein [Deltaproteobacteria bacterium]